MEIDKSKRKYVVLLVILAILFAVVVIKDGYNIHRYDIIIDPILVIILIYAGYEFYKNKDEIFSKNKKNKNKGSKNIKEKK
ncbi:hypothetical protein [Methanobrevibacter sp.]